MRLSQVEIRALLERPDVRRAIDTCVDGDVVQVVGDAGGEYFVAYGALGDAGREDIAERGIASDRLKVPAWPDVLVVTRRPDPADPEFELVELLHVRRRVRN